ncbi:MAG: DNA methyltransferase [Chloroflexota bacterium]
MSKTDLSYITEDLRPLAVEIDLPQPDPANARTGHDIEGIAASLNLYGQRTPIVINAEQNNKIEKGHGTYYAAKHLGWSQIAAVKVADDPVTATGYAIADNRLGDISWFDEDVLKQLFDALDEPLDIPGVDDDFLSQLDILNESHDNLLNDTPSLFDRFVVPPFTILDARQGYWQERKKAWLALGIQSELGGRGKLKSSGSPAGSIPNYYNRKAKCEQDIGRSLTHDEFQENYLKDYSPKNSQIAITETGGLLSIFDPVLTELIYSWFCPLGGSILDPFAGGSVRGIVASVLGRSYIGIDLRAEQVEANEAQAQKIVPEHPPQWVIGDSSRLSKLVKDSIDLVFSCPPYFNLEVYSDDPADLSKAKSYEIFLDSYQRIITQAVDLLKPNRFACFVVGDIRDKKGFYCNFVSDTITAFENSGTKLYNEAILVTVAGSLPIRIGKQFTASRKLGKSHQNILVFCKGDPKLATQALDQVEVWTPEIDQIDISS